MAAATAGSAAAPVRARSSASGSMLLSRAAPAVHPLQPLLSSPAAAMACRAGQLSGSTAQQPALPWPSCSRGTPSPTRSSSSSTTPLGQRTRSNRRGCSVTAQAAYQAGGPPGGGPSQGVIGDLLAYAYAMQMQAEQAAAAQAAPSGASVSVRNLTFHPPGSDKPLLNNLQMEVAANSLGLVIGRSGSGKTTLLQVLAGLCEQTSGSITFGSAAASTRGGAASPSNGTNGNGSGNGSGGGGAADATGGSSLEERMSRVGLVFQFPERHFLGQDVFGEITFAWPRDPAFFMQQQALRARVMKVLQAVRLADIDMSLPPWALSGGQQRRLALAIQLVRQPSLLLLDEPLAGLDWQARQEVVELLARLKKECTLLVVSHDLREVAPLVDAAWSMQLGGTMEPVEWPPAGGVGSLASAAAQLQRR